jgi:manganese/zinc/iron transport system substrate-binding protein
MKLFLFLFIPLLVLSSCMGTKTRGKDHPWFQENGKLKVLTTVAMINDLVKEIGQEDIDTMTLICGELDPHTYELVKGDDEKFARADLIFYNGLGLEHGLSLRQLLESSPKAYALGLTMDPSLILTTKGQVDPHVWMDISLWERYIDPIVETLSKNDPSRALQYKERGEVLHLKMKEADRLAYLLLQSIPQEKRYLVTSHNAFHYFTRRYLSTADEVQTDAWKSRAQAPEGLAPEAQLGFSDLQAIVDHVQKFQIKVLFLESNVNQDSLKKIMSVCKEKGVEIRLSKGTLYADAMGNESSYISMITHNVNLIAKELQN